MVTYSKNNSKRSISILGGAIIKDMKSYKMEQCLSSKDKCYIKSFSGTTTECMTDYVQPSLKYNPDVIILNWGSNNVRSTDDSAEDIANNVINLAKSMKSENNKVIVSGYLDEMTIISTTKVMKLIYF